MAPIVEGNTASEAIKIQNNNNGIILSEEVVHLDSLPEDIKELCNASLKVNNKLNCFLRYAFISIPQRFVLNYRLAFYFRLYYRQEKQPMHLTVNSMSVQQYEQKRES